MARAPSTRSCMLLLLVGVACQPNQPNQPTGDASGEGSIITRSADRTQALGGIGRSGRLRFELELDPASPRVGELFRVTTTVRDARSGAAFEHASFTLDATMPQHAHGMATRPEHRELGGGRYRTEGMKLHMPGVWELSAHARTPATEDSIALTYEQPVTGG